MFLTCSAGADTTDLATLQQNYVNQKYGIFLHYNMGTYSNEEWAHGGLDPNTFNPTNSIKADTDQWAATAKAAGMNYGVLTTKHHDGFSLWDTDQSTYDIASTSWYNDPNSPNYHVDIVKSYADSFRAQGLGVGLYYSIWDKTNGLGPKYYSNDPTVTQKTAAQATAYVEADLNHLLTSYGQIDVLWTDGWAWQSGYNYVNYDQVYAYIKQISPNTLLMENNHAGNLSHTDIVGFEQNPLPPVGNTLPSEVCATIRSDYGWFYHASNGDYLKTPTDIASQIRTTNSCNGTYLLDVPPNQAGQIPASSVQRLMGVKAVLDLPSSLAIHKMATQSSTWPGYPASLAVDGNVTAGYGCASSAQYDYHPWWQVDLGQMTAIEKIDLLSADGYGGLLRDITIEILAADDQTVLYTSSLLNPGNILGGGLSDYVNGPYPLSLDLGAGLVGEFVRVSRTPEAGYATDGNKYRLALAEVGVYAPVPEPSTLVLLILGGLAFAGTYIHRK